MTFGEKMAVIFDDHDKAVPAWGDLLAGIMEDLARLEQGLVDMKLECLSLAESGMWSALPTESWETRNGGETSYLRLLFPAGTNGERRCRVYIGSKPEKVDDARRKAANRQRWERLMTEVCKLEQMLGWVERRLQAEASRLGRYTLSDLGTMAVPRPVAAVPKVEGEHGCRGSY